MTKRAGELSTNFPKTFNSESVQTTLSSGIVTSDSAIITESGVLVAIIVFTDGVNDATVVVYDNDSAASGTVLGKVIVKGADNMGGELKINARVTNGIFVDVSGTGAEVLIRYII